MAYRFYIAESVRLVPQNKWITKSLHQILDKDKADKRTGDEIAVDVIKNAGIKLK